MCFDECLTIGMFFPELNDAFITWFLRIRTATTNRFSRLDAQFLLLWLGCLLLCITKAEKKRTKPNGEIHQAGATGKYQETVSCEREGDKRVGFIYR